MNKLLTICPTLNRKKQFLEMMESFYETSTVSDLIVLTEKESITKLINMVKINEYKYISVTNDDFVYHTKAWDKILIDTIERKGRYGIAFGNDGSNNKHLPVTCVMSTYIPLCLGWIQYPKLTHLCGDMVWQYIGKRLNCLHYVPTVQIEHKHFIFGKADKKDYEISNSKQMYINDRKIFENWLLHEAEKDVEKIRAGLEM